MRYRIWSKKYKMYVDNPLYPDNQYTHSKFVLSQYGIVMELITTDYENFCWDMTNHKETELVVQMFTGLLDKNHKQIYEGDMLKYNPDRNKDGKVIYEPDRGGYLVEGKYNSRIYNRFHLDCDFAFESEVIGNIFEIPEFM